MIIWVFSAFLFLVALWLGVLTWHRGPEPFKAAMTQARVQFVELLPRLAVGFVGAGYIAQIMPRETVLAWFGPGSGLLGFLLAALAGILTPGGPVVGFALGAAALKAGAGLPQVMCFVTAWSLYTLNRVIVWEIPTMPAGFVIVRVIVSLPFPFLVAWLTSLYGPFTPQIVSAP